MPIPHLLNTLLETTMRRASVFLLGIAAAGALPLRAQTNVVFGNVIQHAAQTDSGTVVRIYFDRHGAVYPDARVAVDDRGLRADTADLRAYFANRRNAWDALRQRSGVTSGDITSAWPEVQDSLKSRLVRRLTRLLADTTGGNRTLVVLVHGFHVKNAEPVYALARASITKRFFPRGNVVFLQVNWDGLTGNPLMAWTNVQNNAPLVGLELRPILARISATHPVRILTHSLGASVIASALWNRQVDIPEHGGAFNHYRANIGGQAPYAFPVPSSIRFAMIVPAMPGDAFTMPTPASASDSVVTRYAKVIIGQNHRDIAVTKGPLGPNALRSTALAVETTQFCRLVEPLYRTAAGGSAAHLIDFSHSRTNKRSGAFWDAHDFSVYLERDAMKDFLNLLFTDSASAHGSHALACPSHVAPLAVQPRFRSRR